MQHCWKGPDLSTVTAEGVRYNGYISNGYISNNNPVVIATLGGEVLSVQN